MSLEKTFYLLKAAETRLGRLYAAMGLSSPSPIPATTTCSANWPAKRKCTASRSS